MLLSLYDEESDLGSGLIRDDDDGGRSAGDRDGCRAAESVGEASERDRRSAGGIEALASEREAERSLRMTEREDSKMGNGAMGMHWKEMAGMRASNRMRTDRVDRAKGGEPEGANETGDRDCARRRRKCLRRKSLLCTID